MYSDGGRLIFQANSYTTMGMQIGHGVAAACERPQDGMLVGAMVLRALDASTSGIPHPPNEELRHLADDMLRRAGVRSWRAFAAEASMVEVARDGEVFEIVRLRRAFDRSGSTSPTRYRPNGCR